MVEEERSIPTYLPTKFTHNAEVWQEFAKQEAAFEYSNKNGGNLLVITEELPRAKRKFIVTSWNYFFKAYSRLPPEKRVYYELIREDQPCKGLWMDLDGKKTLNPKLADGSDGLLKEAVERTLKGYEEILKIDRSRIKVSLVRACNDEKYSAHPLFVVDGGKTVWKDREQCRRFITMIARDIGNDSYLLLNDKDKNGVIQIKSAIDASVYAKNSNYRMPMATKLGFLRPLRTEEERKRNSLTVNLETLKGNLITYFPEGTDFGVLNYITLNDPGYSIKVVRNVERPDSHVVYTDGRKNPSSSAPQKRMKTSTTTPQTDAVMPEECQKLLRKLLNEEHQTYGDPTFDRENMIITVCSYKMSCSKCGHHNSNHSRYVFRLREGYWVRKCFSDTCGKNEQELQLFPAKITRLIDDMRKREDTLYETYGKFSLPIAGYFSAAVRKAREFEAKKKEE